MLRQDEPKLSLVLPPTNVLDSAPADPPACSAYVELPPETVARTHPFVLVNPSALGNATHRFAGG